MGGTGVRPVGDRLLSALYAALQTLASSVVATASSGYPRVWLPAEISTAPGPGGEPVGQIAVGDVGDYIRKARSSGSPFGGSLRSSSAMAAPDEADAERERGDVEEPGGVACPAGSRLGCRPLADDGNRRTG